MKDTSNMLKMHITFKISSNMYIKLRVPEDEFLSQD